MDIRIIHKNTPKQHYIIIKGDRTMTLYDELVARGLIAQVTDEEEIKELINNG